MSNYTHDIVATIGEYKDREGNTKKRFQKCGAAFTNDEGQISIKLDAVPCSPDWSGWLSLYPKQDNQHAPQAQQQQRPPAEPVRQQVADEPEDSIPF